MSLPRLLVTRPAARQEPFAGRARALGFETLAFPCLEIASLPGFELPPENTLRGFDAVLFTSRHAVEAAAACRAFPWSGVAVLAIGHATCAALTEAGQPLAHPPAAGATSEAFLSVLGRQPSLQSLLIIKGTGGRTLIAETLQGRGTRVETLDSYRRQLPSVDPAESARRLTEHAPDVLSVTSDEVLDNLVTLAGKAIDELRGKPLVVNSARCAERARDHGFQKPALVASPPGDDGQLAALTRWLNT